MGLDSNFNSFMESWLADVKAIGEKKVFFIIQVCFDALGTLIDGSAVDTGTYRASHDLTISAPSQLKLIRPDEADEIKRMPEAQNRHDEGQGRLLTITPAMLEAGKVDVFITNNLNYAEYLENGDSERVGRALYHKAAIRAEENWNSLVAKGLV